VVKIGVVIRGYFVRKVRKTGEIFEISPVF